MNIKRVKIEKTTLVLLIIFIILVFIVIFIYFNSKNKRLETSTQPINEEVINNVEKVSQNTIVENTENKEDNDIISNNINTNVKNNNTSYYIKVNYGAQVVTVYEKDKNGKYTVPVKAMICSTGTATPKSGVYSIPGRWTWGTLFGNVYGQYCIKITGDILFHSVPYLRKGDPSSLEYWEYDKLGTPSSAGCVRLKVADLIWLYDNCANGTKVEFYSSSDPGPLGKPSVQKISENETCRNWDPTDPNPNNPWRTYK